MVAGLTLAIGGATDALGADAGATKAHRSTRNDPSVADLVATYVLRTRLSFEDARLDVTETVDIENRSPVKATSLDLSVLGRAFGELRIGSVTTDGRPATVSYPEPATMRVALDPALPPAGSLRLGIVFTAHPGPDAHDSLHARLSKAEGILRAADWFPLLSDGHGLRNPGDSQFSAAATSITLDLQVDPSLTVAAPGTLLVRRGGHRIYRLEGARDFGFVVARHLRRLSTTTRDGIRVDVFQPSGAAGRTALRLTREALEAYDDAYGPYPWSRLVVAPTPGGWIATESPGLVFLGADTYARPDVVRHEVAHEWFYALVGNDQLREPWLDESFATFSERALFGRGDWSYCSRKPVDAPVYAFPDTFDRWSCGGYVETVYNKGAAMIAGVLRRLGARRFFATMRRFIDDHRFGIATGTDVLQAWLDAATPADGLRAHLARFLSSRALARVTPTASVSAAGAGVVTVPNALQATASWGSR